MPPRVRVTKEEIVRAATDLVRAEGMECLNARRIASALGCSTQPIFSNFGSMEELRAAVIEDAERNGVYPLCRRGAGAFPSPLYERSVTGGDHRKHRARRQDSNLRLLRPEELNT